jgi:hypothetical protein
MIKEVPMDEIIISIKHFQLTRDIKNVIKRLEPTQKDTNLSAVLTKLYLNEIIDKNDFLGLSTKMLMSSFYSIFLSSFPELTFGVFLYEECNHKIWNIAMPNIPKGFYEYTQGLSVETDIMIGEFEPEYINGIFIIGNTERSDSLVAANHRKEHLKYNLNSVCNIPMNYKGKIIGHIAIYSNVKWIPNDDQINKFLSYSRFIEEKLYNIKDDLIDLVSK